MTLSLLEGSRRSDLVVSCLGFAASLLSSLVIFRLAAVEFGVKGLAVYAVARRVFSLLQPVFGLGIGLALTKKIAENEMFPVGYLRSATVLTLGWFALLAIPILLLSRQVAALLFGNGRLEYLVGPLVLMLLGSSSHVLLYAYLRGRMLFRAAAAVMAANLGLFPAVVFAFTDTVAANLYTLATLWVVQFSIVVALQWGAPGTGRVVPEIVGYGFPRAVADVTQLTLLSLPVLFASHAVGLEAAGALALALAIVNNLAFLFAPLSALLLPITARAMVRDHRWGREFQAQIPRLVIIITALGLGLSVLLSAVGVSLIPAYLGRPAPLVQQAVRYIGWAVCPLALYFAFRGLLDGASDHPINLKNLIASLLVTAVAGSALMLRHADMEAFALLFVASSFLLGALSVVSSNRQLRDSRTWLVEEPSI